MVYSATSSIILASCDLALCWAFTALRLYVRLVLQRAFWVDDFFAVFALCIFTLMDSWYLDALLGGGWRVHASNIRSSAMAGRGLKDLMFCELFYVTGTGMIKISFAFTLLRIVYDRRHKWVIYSIKALVAFFTVFYGLWIILLCDPVPYAWTRILQSQSGNCKSFHSMVVVTYVHSGVMLIADFGLGLILPALLLLPLQMKTRLKVSAGLTFAFASIASISTIARLAYIQSLDEEDLLYAINPLAVWSNIEFAWSIIATAAATLRPLLDSVGLRPASKRQLSGTFCPNLNLRTRPKIMAAAVDTEVYGDGYVGSRIDPNEGWRSMHRGSSCLEEETGMDGAWFASREQLRSVKCIDADVKPLPSFPND